MRSMRKYIMAMTDEHPHMDWEDLLPSMMLSYNCHVHRAILPHVRTRSETALFQHRET
jgi:hypothetical protein